MRELMSDKINSKSFELLYETFLSSKYLLSSVVSKRMITYFKEVAKVIDLYKSYIEFLENENAELKHNETKRTTE